MFTHAAGKKVGKGTYWDMMSGQRVDMAQEGILPGGSGALYLRTPSGAMLFLGPVLGLAYVMVMPIMAVVTILVLLVQKTLGGAIKLTKNIISFGWSPTEAYLGGKNKKKDSKVPTSKQEDR